MANEEESLDYSVLKNLMVLQDDNNPDFLAVTIDIFTMQATEKIEYLSKAIDQKDKKAVKFLAHNLKGSCANLGIIRMKNLCHQLEEIESIDSLASAKDLLTKIENEFSLVTKLLTDAVKNKY